MVICHSETLSRSGQAAAISGNRFFVSQKACFALKLPKFSAARAKEQEATFYCKRGPRAQKVGHSFTQLWHVREFPNSPLPAAKYEAETFMLQQ